MEEAPFEVTETGWGEFQLTIRIVFQDPSQKPLSLVHHLKLYPTDEAANQLKTSKPVISEQYEEVVFDPPTGLMASILSKEAQYADYKTGRKYSESIFTFISIVGYSCSNVVAQLEEAELVKIDAALRLVYEQIADVEQRIAENSGASVAPLAENDSCISSTTSTVAKKLRKR